MILFSQTVCTLYLVINRSCQVWVVGGEGILTNHASRMTQIYHYRKGKASSHCKGNSFLAACIRNLILSVMVTELMSVGESRKK